MNPPLCSQVVNSVGGGSDTHGYVTDDLVALDHALGKRISAQPPPGRPDTDGIDLVPLQTDACGVPPGRIGLPTPA